MPHCDILVFAPHPDDAEIHVGATIAAQVRQGASVVVIDATRGELGSRGTPEIREQEANDAAKILGLHARENLGLPDGFVESNNHAAREQIITCIRTWQPKLILSIAAHTKHPDHQQFAKLVELSVKAAELHKMEPQHLPAWQQATLLCYEGELPITPDVIMSCTEEDWAIKMKAIACYGSQLHKKNDTGEPVTSIGKKAFTSWIEGRGRVWGQHAQADYGEALYAPFEPLALNDLRVFAQS